ncbi:tetratricopeptide repeat protein [Synechococcus sp. HK05]|uniref:tetratricopeptide repeat protein n=1 Tax=Synechococcus sp. HK05 TaxID=2725975 RepID=UPI001C39302D|nr:tetratricopeptide repeat protein [Synechococcus sp. HK05]MBV2352102.1 tetratricopeptide repeat protein [Synechococcus sp. HK05]
MAGFGQSKQRNESKPSTKQLQTLVEEAVRLHKAGQIDEAETLYLQALNSGLEHEIILSNLGVIYKRTNQVDKAIEIYKRAISVNPKFADAHANLGGLLQEKGQHDAALQSLHQAIQLNPRHAVAFSNLALALQATGRHQEAINSAVQAVQINPNLASTRTNLGTVLKGQGQLEQAAAATQEAIKLDSSYIPAYVSLGVIYKELGHLDEALAVIHKARTLKPDYAPTCIAMGSILQERGQLEEAIRATRQAIEIDPSNAVAYVNLGIMLQSNDQLTEAVKVTESAINLDPRNAMAWRSLGAICRDKGDMEPALTATSTSIKLNPNDSVAYMNLGCIYAELCEHEKAERYYEKALEMDPDYVATQVNLSQCQLLRHDYENGWKNYSNRKEKTTIHVGSAESKRMDQIGIDSTKNILIAGEQGIGDQILFASLLNDIQPRCKKAYVTVDTRLLPIVRRSFSGNIEFYPNNVNLPNLPVEDFISMGDLGALVRKDKSSFKAQPTQFFTADVQRVKEISFHLRNQSNQKIIGLSWHSTGSRYFNRNKCIAMDILAPALAACNIDAVKLQYGDCANDVTSARDRHNLTIQEVPDLDVTNDIDGLAALITACDAVVTISNVTAHLAAALGKPTHLLAPASPHFYWGLDGPTTVWYPTVRIYRQTKNGDWTPALKQLSKALQQ